MNPIPVVPLVVFAVIVLSAGWVYSDAKKNLDHGTPVVAEVGNATIETPEVWFVCCVVLWVVALPLYVSCRLNAR